MPVWRFQVRYKKFLGKYSIEYGAAYTDKQYVGYVLCIHYLWVQYKKLYPLALEYRGYEKFMKNVALILYTFFGKDVLGSLTLNPLTLYYIAHQNENH